MIAKGKSRVELALLSPSSENRYELKWNHSPLNKHHNYFSNICRTNVIGANITGEHSGELSHYN